MANTENIEAMLAAYVDDELDAAQRAEIEQHLAANPQHRKLIEDLRQAKQYIKALPRASAPPEIAEALSAQLERAALLGDVEIGDAVGSDSGFSRWPQVRAIAAVLVLTAGLAIVLYKVLPSPRPSSPQVAIVTPEPERPVANSDLAISPRAPSPAESRSAPGAVAGGAAAAGAAPPEMRSLANARRQAGTESFVYVDTTDPTSANQQIVDYLSRNGIDYRATEPSMQNKDLNLPSNAAPTSEPSPDNSFGIAQNEKAKELAASGAFVARMTRRQAAELSDALSQSQQRQSAQVVWPQQNEPALPAPRDDKAENQAANQFAGLASKPTSTQPDLDAASTQPAVTQSLAAAPSGAEQSQVDDRLQNPLRKSALEHPTSQSSPTTAPEDRQEVVIVLRQINPTEPPATSPSTAPATMPATLPVTQPSTEPADR